MEQNCVLKIGWKFISFFKMAQKNWFEHIIIAFYLNYYFIAIFFMEILLQVGRYCSTSSPGPVVSLQKVALGLRVNFYTDNANVSSGFMGQYTFFEEKSAFGGKKKINSF